MSSSYTPLPELPPTWFEKRDASDIEMNTEDWMMDEIDALREVIKARDAVWEKRLALVTKK